MTPVALSCSNFCCLCSFWLCSFWLCSFWLCSFWLCSFWLCSFWLCSFWLCSFWQYFLDFFSPVCSYSSKKLKKIYPCLYQYLETLLYVSYLFCCSFFCLICNLFSILIPHFCFGQLLLLFWVPLWLACFILTLAKFYLFPKLFC